MGEHGEHYGDPHGWQRSRSHSYDAGFADGLRAAPRQTPMSARVWKAMLVLVHPDRWQGTPSLEGLAHEAMVWLNQHRPPDDPRH
jgi:hypothetical protein